MDYDREPGATKHPRESLHPGDVIPMAVAEHDHLDLPGVDAQPAHVLDHPVPGHAGVEQERPFAPGLRSHRAPRTTDLLRALASSKDFAARVGLPTTAAERIAL